MWEPSPKISLEVHFEEMQSWLGALVILYKHSKDGGTLSQHIKARLYSAIGCSQAVFENLKVQFVVHFVEK